MIRRLFQSRVPTVARAHPYAFQDGVEPFRRKDGPPQEWMTAELTQAVRRCQIAYKMPGQEEVLWHVQHNSVVIEPAGPMPLLLPTVPLDSKRLTQFFHCWLLLDDQRVPTFLSYLPHN